MSQFFKLILRTPAMTLHKLPEVLFRNVLRLGSLQSSNCVSTIENLPKQHRAAVVNKIGQPIVIEMRATPTDVKEGHVLLEHEAAGINFADILTAVGQYQVKGQVPYVPGTEICGRVRAVGAGVTNVKPGQKIIGLITLGSGAFAEYSIVDSRLLLPVPDSVPSVTGAAMLVSYGTAMMALTRTAKVEPGETVLVTAAAGATGMAIMDIAVNVIGAKVIAVCGSPEKCALAKRRGASHTIDYNKESIRDRVKDITNGQGVNVVMDQVGGDIFMQCLKSIALEGRIITIGYASGKIPSIPANLLLLKMCSVHGVFWGNTSKTNPQAFFKSIKDVMTAFQQKKITPYSGNTFPLDQVNEAFDLIKSRKSTGKVVIVMKSNL